MSENDFAYFVRTYSTDGIFGHLSADGFFRTEYSGRTAFDSAVDSGRFVRAELYRMSVSDRTVVLMDVWASDGDSLNTAVADRCRRCFHYRPSKGRDGTAKRVCWYPGADPKADECRFFAED